MDIKQALELVTKVTGEYKGTRADHYLLNQALQVISVSVEKGESKDSLDSIAETGDE